MSTETTGRDPQGRFTEGNKFGRGNPHARQAAALRKTLLDKLSTVEMGILVETAIAHAMNGKAAVLRLLFQYALGQPLAGVDPDRLDLHEFECLKAKAIPAEEVTAASAPDTMPLNVAIPAVQAGQQGRTDALVEQGHTALPPDPGPAPVPEAYDNDDDDDGEGEAAAAPPPALTAAEQVADLVARFQRLATAVPGVDACLSMIGAPPPNGRAKGPGLPTGDTRDRR